MQACGNHCCGKQFDAAKDEHVVCPLCLGAAYCDETCRVVDWVTHACPNVTTVGDTVFVEQMEPDELEAIEAKLAPDDPLRQSWLIVRNNGDRTVSQRLVPGQLAVGDPVTWKQRALDMGKGEKPDDRTKDINVSVTVTLTSEGGMSTPSYMSGNYTVSDRAQTSAIHWRDKLLLTFPMKSTDSPMRGSKGKLEVSFFAGNNTSEPVSNMSGPFDVTGATKRGMLRRNLAKLTNVRARSRGYAKGSDLGRVTAVTASYGGVTVVVHLQLSGGKEAPMVEVIGVDVSVDQTTLKNLVERVSGFATQSEIKSELRCDPRSVAQMVGLAMALELKHARGEIAPESALDHAAARIRTHARALMEGKAPPEVPVEVETAIYRAIDSI
jgi:hypothetical protein